MYTHKQWSRDRSFKAEPGEEVERSIYEDHRCFSDPFPIHPDKLAKLGKKYGIEATDGFRMPEPSVTERGFTFRTFCTDGEKYYYLGKIRDNSNKPV